MSADARRHYEAVERAVRAADGVMDAAGETVLKAWERIATGDTPVTNAQRVQFLRDVELVVGAVFVSANMSLDQSLLYQTIKREAERVFVAQMKVGVDHLDEIMKPYPWWPEQRKRLINAPMSTLQRDRLAQAYQVVYGPHVQKQRLLNARLFDPQRRWVDPRGRALSNRIWMQGRQYRDAIDRTIQKGIQQGWSADRMAKELRQYVKPSYAPVKYTKNGRVYRVGSTYRPNAASAARRLARTEITRVHGESTKERARGVPGLKGLRWRTSARHSHIDNCTENAARDDFGLGKGVYPVDETPNYPGHPNCVIPDTEISLTTAISGMKRWYDGDVIEITTDSGNNLTITPNHPVLTDYGWVAAGLIDEGDYLIGGSLREVAASIGVPNNDDGPPAAENLFVSLAGSPSMTSVSVPSTPEQFHGDGSIGEVDVVLTDRLLKGEVVSPILEPSLHQDFTRVSEGGVSLLGSSAGLQLGDAPLLAPDGGMGSGGHSSTLLGTHARKGEALGLWPSSDDDPARLKDSSDSRPAGSVLLGNGVDGFSAVIERDDVFYVGMDRVGVVITKGDALGEEDALDDLECASEMLGNPADRDTSLVHINDSFRCVPERVSLVHRRSYQGYVYNFETPESAYIANNIIVHNCMCTLVPTHYPRDEVRRDIVNKYRAIAFEEAGFSPETGWID